MNGTRSSIEETLAVKMFDIPEQRYHCTECPMKFTTRVGLREHSKAHWEATLIPVSQYVVPLAYLALFCEVSKAELMRSKD